MSNENNSNLFKVTGINSILTIYIEITFQYVMDDGGAVMLLSSTNLNFLVNLLSILIPNIMWTLTCSYSGIFFFSRSIQVKHCQHYVIQYVHLLFLLQYPWSKRQSPIFFQYKRLILLSWVILYQTYVSYASTFILPLK